MLDREIKAFDQMRPELEQHHMGKLIRDQKLIGAFDTLDAAASEAVRRCETASQLRTMFCNDSRVLSGSCAERLPNPNQRQKIVAKLLGVPGPYIGRVLSGEKPMTDELAEKVAEIRSQEGGRRGP